MPGSDPFLTSDLVPALAVGPPVYHPGAASSRAAGVAEQSTAQAEAGAGAGAGAPVTPPTGVTVAVHRSTPFLGPAVKAVAY